MTTKELIAQAEEDLLHTYNRYQIVLDRGEGVYLYDRDGKKYLRLYTSYDEMQDYFPYWGNCHYSFVSFLEALRTPAFFETNSTDYNVEFLGGQLALSRTQIFRRVKTITGKGPLDYIRERRLIRADELLRTTDMTIQQVALQLCFSSPGYFTKCYKEQFGHLPSQR